MNPVVFQLDPEKLNKEINRVLEVIHEHLDTLREQPVKPDIKPGDIAQKFSLYAPQDGRDVDELILQLKSSLLPGLTNWQHPRFFAYYPATTSIPAVTSELLIAALGSVGLQWSANPAATELECVVMDWIMRMLHAPEQSPFLHQSRQGGGIIQNTAGEAIVTIMVAARVQHHLQTQGRELSSEQLEEIYWQDSSRLVVYMSDQTHFSGPKAVRVAGMRLHKIPAQKLSHGNFGVTCDQVRAAMKADREKGLIPCAVLVNYGSTNTSGYDDLPSFRGLSELENVWVHVDAAYAGASLILPEYRERALIVQEIATSFNFNGSKWLLCGFDSAFLFIRDRKLLKSVYAAGGDYLARTGNEDVFNPEFKDWAIPLGRRFRALRIWMVLESFGVKGLQQYLRHTIAQADWFRQRIDTSLVLKQLVRTEFGLVCFHLNTDDAIRNEIFIQKIEDLSGHGQKFLLYPSQLQGQRFFRLALGSVHTQESDLEMLWQLCLETARASL